MSYISLYFLIKLGLYYSHYIGFNWLLNFTLAVVSVWPLSIGRWAKIRVVFTWFLAIILLYHDSYLPTPARVFSQLNALSSFSFSYMLELLGRLYNPLVLTGLAALILIYKLLSSRIRFSTFALAGILSVPFVSMIELGSKPAQASVEVNSASVPNTSVLNEKNPPVALDPQAELVNFYSQENQRHLSFSTGGQVPPFDIILLHICSLSWDDMDFVNEANHPLLKRFDVVFSNFNSAASYSGPASIRVLRGTCGQSPHDKLYKSVDPQCYVFPNLEKIGYAAKGLLNHDGIFDKFADQLEQRTGLKGKLEKIPDAPIALHSFDGSPIYDDFSLLSKWWDARLNRGAAPEALYYNSVTLHDGNIVPGSTSRSSSVTYKPRLIKLMADVDKFINVLEKSGKPVVLMIVPEHGASLRSDKYQISGMREIPSPGITLVPAAIKLIGLKKTSETAPIVIKDSVSFFGLYTLLGGMLADNPFAPNAPAFPTRLKTIEKTKFVSENDDVVVMRDATGRYMMKSSNGAWVPYR